MLLSPQIFQSLFRAAACLCILAIIYFSLAPADVMVRTGAYPHLEHFAAYAGTSFCIVMGWPKWQTCRHLIFVLAIFSGLLELMQFFAVGRNPGLWEFGWNILGIAVGAAMAGVLQPVIASYFQNR